MSNEMVILPVPADIYRDVVGIIAGTHIATPVTANGSAKAVSNPAPSVATSAPKPVATVIDGIRYNKDGSVAKKRGRKPKTEVSEVTATAPSEATGPKKRGRPAGSKNKATASE